MSDLWFVPPSTHSAWFSRLDWYLNWQMSKGLAHSHAIPSADLFRLAGEHGVTIEPAQTLPPHAPLMISGVGLIPAKACVVLPFNGQLETWLAQAKAIAFELRATTARIYLPAGTGQTEAAGSWRKLTGTCTAEFTEDTTEFA